MIVAIASRKGGSGKSTLAVHWFDRLRRLGVPVALLDADPQLSSYHWFDRSGPVGLEAGAGPWSRLEDPELARGSVCAPVTRAADIKALAVASRGVVLIDTAGDVRGATRTAIEIASIVVAPVRPTRFDVESVLGFADLVDAAGVRFAAVLSGVPTNSRRIGQAARAQLRGVEVIEPQIHTRVAIADTIASGTTVFDPRCRDRRAREELAAVIDHFAPPTR